MNRHPSVASSALIALCLLVLMSAYLPAQEGGGVAAESAQASQNTPPFANAGAVGEERFEEMERAHQWKEVFFDAGTSEERTVGWKDGIWKEKWFLDGEIGAVSNEKLGMNLASGPRWKDESHHMVLWTKQEFSGDLKIEYEFTRTDIQDTGSVILIYIQATGDGSQAFPEDIALWSDKRTIPGMGTYFKNMNLYHISYSTGSPFIEGNSADYVRARRYMPESDTLRGTELPQEYANTGLWKPGVTYQMTILKTDREVAMKVKGPETTSYFTFKNEILPPVTHGRIGLRHMYTRSARYKNFKVSEAVAAP